MKTERKPLHWLLAASLALNLGVLGAVAWQQWRPQAAAQHLTDMLELDAAQRQQWQALERPFLQDLKGNWEQIRQHREALVKAIFSATPDLPPSPANRRASPSCRTRSSNASLPS